MQYFLAKVPLFSLISVSPNNDEGWTTAIRLKRKQ